MDHIPGQEMGDLVNDFTRKSLEGDMWHKDPVEAINGWLMVVCCSGDQRTSKLTLYVVAVSEKGGIVVLPSYLSAGLTEKRCPLRYVLCLFHQIRWV